MKYKLIMRIYFFYRKAFLISALWFIINVINISTGGKSIMKAFLILMVCAAFLTSILTAGRETDWGYKDDGETKIRE